MPLPEGYLPRKGDVVVLHAVVKYDVNPKEDADSDDGVQVWVTPLEHYSASRIPLKTLVGLYSRSFAEGERVRVKGEGPVAQGVVISTHEDVVWMKLDENAGFGTYFSCGLEPVPDPLDEPFVEAPAAPAPSPMRFAVEDIVIYARPPEDPVRGEMIEHLLGKPVKILAIDRTMYRVQPDADGSSGAVFFATDDMLDPLPPPKRIDGDGNTHF